MATVKSVTLACIVLHNLCISLGDTAPRHWDINVDPETNRMRPRNIVRELLQMRKCRPTKDSSKEAVKIRNYLQDLFANEREQY